MLTHAELCTHGSGIGGSWIEPKGERLLAFLRATDLDGWLDEMHVDCDGLP